MSTPETCHDCGAAPGEFHQPGCDVERCPFCGSQITSCGCIRLHFVIGYDEDPSTEQSREWERALNEKGRLPWTGEWPGVAECREFGWYSYWELGETTRRRVSCSADHPEASEDLNRLYSGEAVWDADAKRWRRR